MSNVVKLLPHDCGILIQPTANKKKTITKITQTNEIKGNIVLFRKRSTQIGELLANLVLEQSSYRDSIDLYPTESQNCTPPTILSSPTIYPLTNLFQLSISFLSPLASPVNLSLLGLLLLLLGYHILKPNSFLRLGRNIAPLFRQRLVLKPKFWKLTSNQG